MNEGVFIHESTNVSYRATIGANTKVWINAQIRENAIIGENCIIGKDTYIDEGVVIGNGVKIQNGVSIYKGVTIEDNVFIGPNVTFTNDMYPRAFNKEWAITTTLIKKGASIGANATVVCGIRIGEYAMVGAGSVVTKNVDDYTLVIGNPARKHCMVCKCGKTEHIGCDCKFEISADYIKSRFPDQSRWEGKGNAIGIFTDNYWKAKNILDDLYRIDKEDIVQYQVGKTYARLVYKDETIYMWIRPNNSARGHRVKSAYIDSYMSLEQFYNIVMPICLYCSKDDITVI